jgi:two-component system OmpR family sensor kinase
VKAITFSLIIAVVISSVSLGWLIDYTYAQLFSSGTSEIQKKVSLLKISGQAIADSIEGHNDTQQVNALISRWKTNPDISIRLFSVDNIALPNSLLQQLKAGEALLLENKEGTSFSYYLAGSEQILQVSSPTLFVEEDPVGQLILTLFFYLCLSLLLTLWAYPLAKRLYSIKTASASIGKGDLHTRINVGNVAGIKDVELAFNNMASRIQTLLYDVKLLSGGVSHDLKTSLARLRLGIDILEDDPGLITEKQITRLSKDTDDMIHLVNMMLQYTQLDMELASIKKEKVNLIDVLSNMMLTFSQHADKVNVSLVFSDAINEQGRTNCLVLGQIEYLKMMLNNLVSNALNYASQRVEVQVDLKDSTLFIQIQDDGPGIAPEYITDVFKPFFRAPENQVSKSVLSNIKNKECEKHYGLGLAISQRIAQMHNGNIQVESVYVESNVMSFDDMRNQPGTTFTIDLPVVS